MSAAPTVSVIIPVHDRAAYVSDAIRSVLAQSLADLELIVVDDGSTDDTVAVVRSFADPRLRLVRHEVNRGIPAARNTGLDEARGRYIAWLDSDDIARPRRLAVQVRFLEDHPAVALVGACAGKLDARGRGRPGIRVPPLRSEDIRAWLLFRSAFQQSAVTGRAEVLKRFRYRLEYPVCEDVDLFVRMSAGHVLRNLPRILIDRRIHDGQTIRTMRAQIGEREAALLAGPLERIGLAPSRDDLRRHVALASGRSRHGAEFLDWAEQWLLRLREANARTGRVDGEALRLATGFFWLRACLGASRELGAAATLRVLARSRLGWDLFRHPGRVWLGRAMPMLAGHAIRTVRPRLIAG